MSIRRTISVGMTLLSAALMAACATAARDQPPAQGNPLAGSEWVLVSLNGNAPIEGKAIALRFGDTSIEGSGGCNTYWGSYTVSEDGLTLSDVYWTEIGCMEPAGIMEQEQAYFQALNATVRYRLDGDRLELHNANGAQRLVYVAAGVVDTVQATPMPDTPAPTATSTPVPPTVTPTPVPPTATSAAVEPPAGFRRYVNGPSGVSLWVPENWTIIEPGTRGGSTILLSYPKDKYAGGEAFKPEDTKCDLTIHPPEISVADVVPQNRSDPPVTVVSEQEIVLRSGLPGTRFEVESMGRSLSLVTEVNERAVVLACFGELDPFDEIAVTLAGQQEFALTATIEAQESLPTGAVVNVRFTLTNMSSEGFFVLKWFTPLEGLAGDTFRVQREGVDLPYRGKLVKRGPPTPEDYVWIDAGGSISAEVDLAEGYDLSKPGHYTLQFRSHQLSHTARTSGEQADSFDELEMIRIPSDPVSVTVAE